ncbi:hypothetical protein ACFFJT_07010 [Dyella flava]|uniref:Uncharacterized protein n=1 Tax=Dyella flava TaxID=1920170 RepID=A0ABS2K7Z0_9GAMM|nr:hypothetical protein [Dyella flava]MBM7127338.1 hypothetical protein [Dyella flava]GLQ50935.1 hypothetical protein GCM10010872_23840 [Dyella flava]
MKDVVALLRTGGALAYLVLALFALPVLARGMFALKRSRSQERKEFLELWKDGDKADDFWLELMIRHCFGEALPAVLVRRVMCFPAAPSKLASLARSWSLLTYDTEMGRLEWRSRWREVWRWRGVELRVFEALYMVLGSVGLLSVWAWFILSERIFLESSSGLVAAAMILPHLVNLDSANDAFKELSPLLAHKEGLRVDVSPKRINELEVVEPN